VWFGIQPCPNRITAGFVSSATCVHPKPGTLALLSGHGSPGNSLAEIEVNADTLLANAAAPGGKKPGMRRRKLFARHEVWMGRPHGVD
jgi:hypothetical protein